MIVRKGLVGVAAAMLAMGSFAMADNATTQPVASDIGVQPMTADLTTEKPLQQQLDKVGLKSMPFAIQGFIEAGYMYDTSRPRIAEGPDFEGYDGYKNRLVLDNVDLQIIKTPTASATAFDWGFTLEGGYGSDYTFIHSNGMMDNRAGLPPQNQSDIDQAFLSFNIPVAGGITLNAGKFFTPLGYEVYDDLNNPLFSHSYAFLYAIPVTQTGVTATMAVNSQINAEVGITEGWDQSLRNTTGDVDFLGEVVYTPNKTWNVTANLSEGPEAPHLVGPAKIGVPADHAHWWTVLDAAAHYTFSDQLNFGAGGDYGDAPHTKFGSSTGAAQWYGLTSYAQYTLIKQYLIANGRLEWYDDTDGFTLAGVHTSVYSATAGVTYYPMPNDPIFQYLEIRPEIRYDYSTKPIFGGAEGSGDHSQLNLAADVIMQY